MKNHADMVKPLFVLGLIFVLAGCSDLFMNKPGEQNREIPDGEGIVQWSVETQIGRTMFPTVPFTKFELTFSATGKTSVTKTFTESSGELALESGRWGFAVNAYIGADLVAQGSVSLVVQGGQTNSVRITLKILGVSGTGTGTLSYSVTLPVTELLYADLSATSMDGAYSEKISLMTVSSGSLSLADGYYILTFMLREANRRADITEVVHIYHGRTTSWTYDFASPAAAFVEAPGIDVPFGGSVVLINSAADLAAIADDIGDPAKNNGKNAYILDGDIDLSVYNPWTPVGSEAAPFIGYLYGDGYTIRGLKLPSGNVPSIGFFGKTSDSVIENINIKISDTDLTLDGTSEQAVGIIAGYAENTVVRGVQLGAEEGERFSIIKADGLLYVGSIAGKISGAGSKIEKSSMVFDIAVQSGGGAAYAGGLVGQCEGRIDKSFAVGRIVHTNTAGGAALYTAGLANGGTQENCYFNGNITATGANLQTSGLGGDVVSLSYAAGSLVNNGAGSASGLSSGATVNNSTALNLAVGGFAVSGTISVGRIGASNSGVTYANNYALTNMAVNGRIIADAASIPQNDKNGLGKTAAELQTQSTYEAGLGWDFTGVWEMGPVEYPYPILKRQKGEIDLPDGYGFVELPKDLVVEFTNLSELGDCLTAFPQNSALNPYPVKLNVSDINTVNGNILAGKHVNLDLSGCGGNTIVYEAFSGCSSLESITIPAGVTSIAAYAFHGCSSLESITIPAGVTSIQHGIFWDCSSLESVSIPAGVTSIESYAFRECSSLESITIPASVTSIGYLVFNGSSLRALVCEAVSPPTLAWDDIYYNSLIGTPASLVISVPAASVNAYKTAAGWSEYADKITAIP